MVLSNFDLIKSILMPMCEQQRALSISVQYKLQNDLHREMMLSYFGRKKKGAGPTKNIQKPPSDVAASIRYMNLLD